MANAKRAVEQDEIGKPYRSEADVSILLDRVESGQLPEHVAEHAALGVFGGADRIVDSAETVFHPRFCRFRMASKVARSEEHTSELQSLMRISYAVFCLKKKKKTTVPIISRNNNALS